MISSGKKKERGLNSPINRKKKTFWERYKNIDLLLLFVILLLIAFGSLMVFSASSAYAEIRFQDRYYFVSKQIVWVGLGLAAMCATAALPLDKLKGAVIPLYLFTLVLLILVPLVGKEAGGAKRWIAIGSFTFQPSELSKTVLILVLSKFLSENAGRIRNQRDKKGAFLYGILYPVLILFSVCVPVALEKHLSCIIILSCICLVMMLAAGSSGKTLGLICGGGAAAVGTFAMAIEYTRRRITIWLNPELYPRDGGWQTLQGMMAIGSGGLFGLGLGKSRLKYLYVSEPQNDFIFTILCEELGFLGAFCVLLLFAVFVHRGITVSLTQKDGFSSLVALGLSAKVAIQVLLNVGVITNTIPNTGISLPFFSYGGSSLVMLFAEMGILLSASSTAYMKR